MLSQPSYTEALAVQEDRREMYGDTREGKTVIRQCIRTGVVYIMTECEWAGKFRHDPHGWRRPTSDEDARAFRDAIIAQQKADGAAFLAAIEANKRRAA